MSHPLLGTPILKKLIKENDLELFSYDETFSHIVPNGKEVFTTLAELSNKDFKELPLPIDQEDLPKETILKAIDTACLALNITIPKITIKQSDTPSDEPLPEALNTAIRLANSGLKQGSETLAFAIKEGNQPIVERLLKHPLLCHNYEAHAHALFAAATANDGERVHSLLADPTTLGRYSLWYRALALIEAAKNGHLQLTLDLFKPELVTQYLNKLVNAFHRAAEGGH